MRALGACFHAGKVVFNREVNRAIIAEFKMQAGVVFYTAPIPPIKAIAADKIHRAGNILAVALCHH